MDKIEVAKQRLADDLGIEQDWRIVDQKEAEFKAEVKQIKKDLRALFFKILFLRLKSSKNQAEIESLKEKRAALKETQLKAAFKMTGAALLGGFLMIQKERDRYLQVGDVIDMNERPSHAFNLFGKKTETAPCDPVYAVVISAYTHIEAFASEFGYTVSKLDDDGKYDPDAKPQTISVPLQAFKKPNVVRKMQMGFA